MKYFIFIFIFILPSNLNANEFELIFKLDKVEKNISDYYLIINDMKEKINSGYFTDNDRVSLIRQLEDFKERISIENKVKEIKPIQKKVELSINRKKTEKYLSKKNEVVENNIEKINTIKLEEKEKFGLYFSTVSKNYEQLISVKDINVENKNDKIAISHDKVIDTIKNNLKEIEFIIISYLKPFDIPEMRSESLKEEDLIKIGIELKCENISFFILNRVYYRDSFLDRRGRKDMIVDIDFVYFNVNSNIKTVQKISGRKMNILKSNGSIDHINKKYMELYKYEAIKSAIYRIGIDRSSYCM